MCLCTSDEEAAAGKSDEEAAAQTKSAEEAMAQRKADGRPCCRGSPTRRLRHRGSLTRMLQRRGCLARRLVQLVWDTGPEQLVWRVVGCPLLGFPRGPSEGFFCRHSTTTRGPRAGANKN